MRSVDEWIGSSDDAKIPDRVRVRVFERFNGICQLTGIKLKPGEWDVHHRVPLKDGGKHVESNLIPVWRVAHREQTGRENRARARINRKKYKHLLPKKAGKIKSRGFGRFESNAKQTGVRF